ncbi:hypothetical protein PI95_005355 [Hassallia byssoidea VB512170]|uniref:Uncharacterized protein n=1 Tax=Hassallia byssoidea VB512170 TaxID=1304833 RepID=A0A846H4H0_9CYAN|nr:hypothetical protein [Hassalia byssoidea]NEU72013.1 hypothetical protein [Hassalia byssoidea VB512170]
MDLKSIPHSPLPTPHSPLPIPHSPLPIPHSPLPIPHSPLPHSPTPPCITSTSTALLRVQILPKRGI